MANSIELTEVPHQQADSATQDNSILVKIKKLVQQDYCAFEEKLNRAYQSEIPLINEVSQHIVASGGKRIRPICLLLAAKALACEDSKIISAAVAVEYIHTATLLHDDVVDESDLRRNHPTARKLWGNMASILVGDYLYSQAFALLVSLNRLDIMPLFVSTTTLLAEGEAFQLMNRNNAALTEKEYRYIIANKTGVLFEMATVLAGMLSNANEQQKNALGQFGMHLGLAFQMIDDALDYQGDRGTIGKNIGDDLAEGSPTLPIIYALENGTPAQKALLEKAIKQGSVEDLDKILAAIAETGAATYTARCAQKEAGLALKTLEALPPSPYRDGLADLAKFAVSRQF